MSQVRQEHSQTLLELRRPTLPIDEFLSLAASSSMYAFSHEQPNNSVLDGVMPLQSASSGGHENP